MSDTRTTPCICCGEPATRTDVDGLPLCEGDYAHLAAQWREEGVAEPVANHMNGGH